MNFDIAGFQYNRCNVIDLIIAVCRLHQQLLSLIFVSSQVHIFARKYKGNVGIIKDIIKFFASIRFLLDSVETTLGHIALSCMVLHYQVRNYVKVISSTHQGYLGLVIERIADNVMSSAEQLVVIKKTTYKQVWCSP